MADREDETVTIRPVGILGILAEKALPQAVSRRGSIHRRAEMTGVRLLHGVDAKRAQGIDAELVEPGLTNHSFPPLERDARLGTTPQPPRPARPLASVYPSASAKPKFMTALF